MDDIQSLGPIIAALVSVIVTLSGVIVYLFRLLIDEKDKRLQDAINTKNTVAEALKSMEGTMGSMLQLLKVISKNEQSS